MIVLSVARGGGVVLGLGAWILVVAGVLALIGAGLAVWSLWRTRGKS